jgi:phytoene dehydrogenase-like protein
LSEGQNLYRYFKYLGIMDELELKKLDEFGFDVVSFGDSEKVYRHAQGYENFINVLLEDFPEEEKGIRAYCDKLKETCASFPLYHLENGKPYHQNNTLFEINAKECISSFTENEELRAVLAATNLLYAGDSERTPFYVHALTVNSYIESSYRCVNGGSQITKLLIRRLRDHDGDAFKHKQVVKFNHDGTKITSAITKDGTEVYGDIFISNIDPKHTIKLTGQDKFRKSYVKRVLDIENTISAFSLYIVLKPESYPYENRNFYHSKKVERVWDTQSYTQETWPESYMISMGVKKNIDEWGENMTIMVYMNYDEVKEWEDTFNTVAHKNDRGESYEQFKERKSQVVLNEVYKKFPKLEGSIESYYSSTPLSFRDYIGAPRGGAYGYIKDVANPLKSFVSPRTKVPNLYLTGQCLNMHGILGVTISAALTCSEIVGGEKLLSEIWKANEEIPTK